MKLSEGQLATIFSMEDYSGCDCRLCKNRDDIRHGLDPYPPQCRFYHDGYCHGYEYVPEFDLSNMILTNNHHKQEASTMTKAQAIQEFQHWAEERICDTAPATLRTCWNMYTDNLSKNGVPKAYNWVYPKTFIIHNRKCKTEVA
jgi:hypothetical protein